MSDSVQLTDQLSDTQVAKRPRTTPPSPSNSTYPLGSWEPADPNDVKVKQERTVRSMVNLCNHFYTSGLLGGIGSDIVVSAFDRDWNLHRIVLCNSPYFEALFRGSWKESDGPKLVLKFDNDYITEEAFSTAIARLYGRLDNPITEQNLFNLLAMANYFQMEDFAWDCVNTISGNLRPETILKYLNFTYNHYFGEFSAHIISRCHAALCRDGYDALKPCWVHLPPSKLQQILSSDSFWAPSEYDRYLFVRDLWLERKALMKAKLPDAVTSPETLPEDPIHRESTEPTASNVLEDDDYDDYDDDASSYDEEEDEEEDEDEDEEEEEEEADDNEEEDADEEDEDEGKAIYRDIFDNLIRYTHMTFKQINAIQNDKDPNTGRAYVNPTVLQKALWEQVDLGVRIMSTKKTDTLVKNGYRTPEPFRFGVEFKDLQLLLLKKMNDCVSSPSFFYAGSEWRVRIENSTGKAGDPLSIYLQRLHYDESLYTSAISATAFSRYQDPRKNVKLWFRISFTSCGPSYELKTIQQMEGDKFSIGTTRGQGSYIIKEHFVRNVDGLDIPEKLRISVVMGIKCKALRSRTKGV